MDTFERIQRLLSSSEWTQVRLAERLGVSQSTINRWSQRGVEPRGQHRDAIADLYREQFMGRGWPTGEAIEVPLLTWVSAGNLNQDDVAQEAIGTVSVSDLPPGDWFALQVTGDSMDRISPPDSIIFVNRRDTHLVANACYVIGDGEGNATYKRFRPNPMRFEPVSTNPGHEPIFPDNDPTIIGRVGLSQIRM